MTFCGAIIYSSIWEDHAVEADLSVPAAGGHFDSNAFGRFRRHAT